MDFAVKDFHATMKMIASDTISLQSDNLGSSSFDANNQNLPLSDNKDKWNHLSSSQGLGASNSQGIVNSSSSDFCDGDIQQDLPYHAENKTFEKGKFPFMNHSVGTGNSFSGEDLQNRGEKSILNTSSCDVNYITSSQENNLSFNEQMLNPHNASFNTCQGYYNPNINSVEESKNLQNGCLDATNSRDSGQCGKESDHFVEDSEMQPRQRRKSRKPLKSSIRYVKAVSDSPLSTCTELSPPPTLSSPSLPCTPPVSVQAPLSPPLSDVQSSLSSLSPCSSVNSDENKCAPRAPLPRLLPIDNWPASSAVLNKLPNKIDNSSQLKQDEQHHSFISNPDELPPPPPYPKVENIHITNKMNLRSNEAPNSNDSAHEEMNESCDAHEQNQCREDNSRPPPPPYHSHFFSHLDKKLCDSPSDISNADSESSTLCPTPNLSRVSSLNESFWSSVHLPSSLSVSAVGIPDTQLKGSVSSNADFTIEGSKKACKKTSDGDGDNKSACDAFPANSMAMLLQRLTASQNRECGNPANDFFMIDDSNIERHDGAMVQQALKRNDDIQHPEDSSANGKKAKNTINIDIDKNNLTSILNNLIAKNVVQPNGLSADAPNASHSIFLPSDRDSPSASGIEPQQTALQSPHPSFEEQDAVPSPYNSDKNDSCASSPSTSKQRSQVMDLVNEHNSQRMDINDQAPEDVNDQAMDLGKHASNSSDDQQSASPDNNAAAVAALVAAAVQGSFSNPLMPDSSPLSALLAGNAGSDFSRCASLFAPGMDLMTLTASLSGMPCGPFRNESAVDGKSMGPDKLQLLQFDKSFLENFSMNNLGNMAALTYLLQQQQQLQLESAGLGSGNITNALNGLTSLPPLNGLAGLQAIPGLEDITLQQALKKMRYTGDASMPVKRKPRSSNHTKSFHCSLCSKRFSLKDELEEHMLTHTSDELGNESYMQKSFACTECSFRTKYKFCLQRHMHIHSGEKPLVCPYCRYRSISKVSYDNHIRTHTGEKPFSCPYCSYKSSFKNNLTKHIKTHTGSGKPYTCNKCSCCFSSQMQLKTHMRLHMDPTGTHSCTQCLYTCMSRFELECHMRTHLPM